MVSVVHSANAFRIVSCTSYTTTPHRINTNTNTNTTTK